MIPASLKFKRQPMRMIGDKPLFISDGDFQELRTDLHTGFVNNLKTSLKKISWLYAFIFYFLAPALFLGRRAKSIYEFVPKGGLVAEVGSGNRRIHPDVINIDIHPWDKVDIIADAHDLPLADESVDGIVFDWVLEHMRDPVLVASELQRVLKRGGYLYLATNFITPYHPSPKDYYRWTADGLRTLFSDFEIVELKPTVGPTCALLSVLQEWVALALSFNIKLLKDLIWIAMVVLTSPLKIFDYLFIHYQSAETITAGFYLIAKKIK